MKCEEMLQLFIFHPYCMELQGKGPSLENFDDLVLAMQIYRKIQLFSIKPQQYPKMYSTYLFLLLILNVDWMDGWAAMETDAGMLLIIMNIK